MKVQIMKVVLGVLFSLSCLNAHAFQLQGTSSGGFTNAVAADGVIVTPGITNNNNGGSFLSTGNGPSTIEYIGNPFDVDLNTPFTFGLLTFFNGINSGLVSADSVDLNATLNFSDPATLVQPLDTFLLTIENTPNLPDDPDNIAIANVILPSTILDFGIAGMFRFDFLGLDTGNGVNAPELAFGIPEEEFRTVGLVGNLTAVPIPAAVWLFGSALVGLVSIGRKKS